MARDMIQCAANRKFVSTFSAQNGQEVDVDLEEGQKTYDIALRIGIHVGPAVGSVLGSIEAPRFTLLGDTINTSSRVEASSLPNRIQLSQSAADMLQQQSPEVAASLVFRGYVELKGKGSQKLWWLPQGAGPRISNGGNCKSGLDALAE